MSKAHFTMQREFKLFIVPKNSASPSYKKNGINLNLICDWYQKTLKYGFPVKWKLMYFKQLFDLSYIDFELCQKKLKYVQGCLRESSLCVKRKIIQVCALPRKQHIKIIIH